MSDVQYYYCLKTRGFYESDMWAVVTGAGLTIDDLTPIDTDTYWSYVNPPEGKYLVFDETGPHLEDYTIPETDPVQEATQKRDSLINQATSKIIPYQTKLLLGRELTDDETATLNSLLDYIDELNSLDLSTAPDIDWPQPPE